MESSSGDSFLWTDASNNSSNMSMESEPLQEERELEAGTSYNEHAESNVTSHDKSKDKKKQKKLSLKRPGADCINGFQSDGKQIKLEPESDMEARRKEKRTKKNIESNDSILNDEHNLNMRVKHEQASLVEASKSKKEKRKKISISDDQSYNVLENYLDMRVKEEQCSLTVPEFKKAKKKKKHKHSNLDNTSPSDGGLDNNEMESYLNMRVKQEQASVAGSEVGDFTKKKSHRRSTSSDIGNASESKSGIQLNGNNIKSNFVDAKNEEYVIVEDKFSAEETIVEKPKKKKHRKDNVEQSSTDKKRKGKDKEEADHTVMSIQPNDFTCSNIASSTIINVSSQEAIDDNHQEVDSITEDVLRNDYELPKRTKISDRIRFEDDESLSQDVTLNITSSKVKSFLKANLHLQVTPKKQNNLTITDDEIWILRCPHEISHQKFKNTKLSLEGKCKIKINSQTYDGVLNEGLNRITVMTYRHGQGCLSNLPVKGCINCRKRIPKVHIPEKIHMVNNQTDFIPLPDTKCRHPLFGANYKKAIKIPGVVKERLEAAKSRHEEIQSTTKKKRKKNSINIKMEEYCEVEPELIRKNKKRKHNEDDDGPPLKKTKHKKPKTDLSEVWESEKAIEENLFNF